MGRNYHFHLHTQILGGDQAGEILGGDQGALWEYITEEYARRSIVYQEYTK